MNDVELGRIVSSSATRHEAPERLRRKVSAALAESGPGRAMPDRKAATNRREWFRLTAAFACGLAVALISTWLLRANTEPDRFAAEAVSAHVRSLMGTHLMDVASSDQHTVKPWFNGKLTFSPPVHDLASEGFPLAGGRLDYLDRQPVAALVYRHRLHVINLFVAPCRDGPSGSRTSSIQGFNVVGWCSGDMRYWAVSDLNQDELLNFTRLVVAGT